MRATQKARASTKGAKKKTGVKKATAATAAKADVTKARAAKPRAKKASTKKASVKKAGASKPSAKTTKVRAKKKATARVATARKSHMKVKSNAKTARRGPQGARRKPPIARRSAPKARERAVTETTSTSDVSRAKGQTETKAPREMEPHGVAEAMMPRAADSEMSREPLRGGYHDPANHSRPDVQIQKQHMRVLRGPERRATMRGH